MTQQKAYLRYSDMIKSLKALLVLEDVIASVDTGSPKPRSAAREP
jgi:hypothetical protein